MKQLVMVQEHSYVFHGEEAVGDTIVRDDLGGWETPEAALAEALEIHDGIERRRFRNGWEERSAAHLAEHRELGITTLITRIWFEHRDIEPALAEAGCR